MAFSHIHWAKNRAIGWPARMEFSACTLLKAPISLHVEERLFRCFQRAKLGAAEKAKSCVPPVQARGWREHAQSHKKPARQISSPPTDSKPFISLLPSPPKIPPPFPPNRALRPGEEAHRWPGKRRRLPQYELDGRDKQASSLLLLCRARHVLLRCR